MYHIIINPASKSGKGIKLWKQLEPVFTKYDIPYRMIYSEYPGHIVKIVAKLTDPLEGYDHINLIVVGGDGTMNEVLQGIIDFDRISIGYIPTGSSNDFARALGYPKDPVEQLENILNCETPLPVDIGVLTYLDAVDDSGNPITITRRFDVSCGIGFDAAVCEEAMHTDGIKGILNKLGLGKLTYLAIALKQLLTDTGVSISYTLDSADPVKLNRFLFIAIMQNKYEGGGFMFCPDADPTDGVLDLCIINAQKKSSILMGIPLAFKGKHTIIKGIECTRAHKVRIRTSGELWVHTDGEVHRKSKDFSVETLPYKLNLLK
ncbi:MAG: diacylglycerol kinase family lipid kinase [Lachnospiraceae bacterium]|nr:diacylglycerol kinase family lipid kinase [Lachnospiraceae bacterium]